jgi:hypothetical protein
VVPQKQRLLQQQQPLLGGAATWGESDRSSCSGSDAEHAGGCQWQCSGWCTGVIAAAAAEGGGAAAVAAAPAAAAVVAAVAGGAETGPGLGQLSPPPAAAVAAAGLPVGRTARRLWLALKMCLHCWREQQQRVKSPYCFLCGRYFGAIMAGGKRDRLLPAAPLPHAVQLAAALAEVGGW